MKIRSVGAEFADERTDG